MNCVKSTSINIVVRCISSNVKERKTLLQSMKLARSSRIVAALFALMSVLFSQLAVAAYVCQSTQLSQAITAAQEYDPPAGHQQSPDCAELDSNSPALCHAHCQLCTQSLDKPPAPNISPFVAMKLLAAIGQDHKLLRVSSYTIDPVLIRPTSAPSLSIRNCCFRICPPRPVGPTRYRFRR